MIREEYIFFDVDAASKEELLDFISEKALEFGITDSKEGLKDAFLKREEEYQLNTEIFGNYIENEKVKWSISNNTSSDTKISDAGYLTITKDENSKKYSLQRKRQMDIKTQLQ